MSGSRLSPQSKSPNKGTISFAGGGSCFQLVKMASVKGNKATSTRTRCAYNYILAISGPNSQFLIRNSISANCRQDGGAGV